MATLTIELPDSQATRLRREAEATGIDESLFVSRLIESALSDESHQTRVSYTAYELNRMLKEERDRYMRVAAEDAAPLYEADLALPRQERELTLMSTLAGENWE